MHPGPSTLSNTLKNSSASGSFAEEGYSVREVGQFGTVEWRLFLQQGGKDVSPWHDIPLLAAGSDRGQLLFSFVNECTRGTRPKLEVTTDEPGNALKQDTKKGKLRNFTYGDLPFNYGMMPQTWEDPSGIHVLTSRGGDNDPLDVVELSSVPLPAGTVRAVKVLGVMALIDEEETDWKILAIDASHPLAEKLHNSADLEQHMPGAISTVRDWFRLYKTTDGKPVNEFAAAGAVLDVPAAHKVIWETHAHWADLVKGNKPNPKKLALPQRIEEAAAKGEPKPQ